MATTTPIPTAFARFFAHESAGGIVLAVAALLALILSNSPWAGAYEALLNLPGEVRVGRDWLVLAKPLIVWVNELWMAVFFLVVGLEIKRELGEGELASWRQAALPAVAALGGMALPALIYAAINLGDTVALRGWAIPAATDIAFAIGVLMLLGPRVPASLKVFVTAVAIIDDLGAIVVIALFYTEKLSLLALAGAALGMAMLLVLNRMRVMRIGPYVVVGLLIWLCVLKSGVHATLAGVVTAMAIPLRDAHGASPLQSLEHALHPWVAFLVLPVFAFSNAGVSLAGVTASALLQPVTLGIVLGLVVGKAAGVFGTSWLLVRLEGRAATRGRKLDAALRRVRAVRHRLHDEPVHRRARLRGPGRRYAMQVKLGVLGASLIAAVLGALILVRAAPRP